MDISDFCVGSSKPRASVTRWLALLSLSLKSCPGFETSATEMSASTPAHRRGMEFHLLFLHKKIVRMKTVEFPEGQDIVSGKISHC